MDIPFDNAADDAESDDHFGAGRTPRRHFPILQTRSGCINCAKQSLGKGDEM
jgi:hypothetical protein